MIVSVAVGSKTSATDKLYDYSISEADAQTARVGSRVTVPFGRGNKPVEGYIMFIKPSTAKNMAIKEVLSVSEERAFDESMLVLINRMREKYLAGYYDIIRTISPAAFRSKRVGEKTQSMARLAVPEEEAEEYIRSAKSKKRAAVAELLLYNGFAAVQDICDFTVCSRAVIRAVEKDGIIEIFKRGIVRDPYKNLKTQPSQPPVLTEEQSACLERIYKASDEGRFEEFLLHGVTGSGKTEVFLRAIDHVLEKGGQAVMLVPEISLTPQMVRRFTERFGDKVAVYHSGLSMGERCDQWRLMRSGKKSVVVGARSAVFAPFSDPGIFIIDESHSEVYKSESSPRYDAREIAVMRAKLAGIPVISASATPSVTDYKNALDKKTTLLEMTKRVNNDILPRIIVADMRSELAMGNRSMFSEALRGEMEKNLERGEQTILFLNRRGFSTFVSCRECGYTAKCPNCSITLTYHRYGNMLRCHYCGFETANYTKCPSCGSGYIRYFGGGTQKVETEAHRMFPKASVLRMDVDTTSGKLGHEKLLERFEKEKTDILIGTQMVAKGLDFENVTLVGVISADTMLNLNDYRASERTFAMLEQVSGRAGRGSKKGRAVIQTYTPQNEAVALVKTHDYKAFFKSEISTRQELYYPPYCELIGITVSSLSERRSAETAMKFAGFVSAWESADTVRILGPIPAPVSKVQNRYRWQLIIKAPSADRLNEILLDAKAECMKGAAADELTIVIDKNPNGM